jgi:hypothetical protein
MDHQKSIGWELREVQPTVHAARAAAETCHILVVVRPINQRGSLGVAAGDKSESD